MTDFLRPLSLVLRLMLGSIAMIPVQLNPDEAAMLHKILLSYLSDLRVEIASMDIALNARSSSIEAIAA